MQRGWFKVWRKIEDNSTWSRGIEYRGLLFTILQKANWKTGFFQGREIQSGQFATSGDSLAFELKINRNKVLRLLKKLSEDGIIRVENVNNRFTLITVLNWDTYQGLEEEVCTTDEQPVNNQRTTSEQPVNTIKEGKKVRRKESKKEYIPELSKFVEDFQKHISDTFGKQAPKITDSSTEKSKDTIEKLIRLDGFTLEEIKNAMRWAVTDSFWSDKVGSLVQLRKKSQNNGLTKFQNIMKSYKEGNKNGNKWNDFETGHNKSNAGDSGATGKAAKSLKDALNECGL